MGSYLSAKKQSVYSTALDNRETDQENKTRMTNEVRRTNKEIATK